MIFEEHMLVIERFSGGYLTRHFSLRRFCLLAKIGSCVGKGPERDCLDPGRAMHKIKSVFLL